MDPRHLVLTFQCDDRRGIVAAVTSLFAQRGYNIVESSQYQDARTQRFFMRTEYESCNENNPNIATLEDAFRPLASEYSLQWELSLKRRSYKSSDSSLTLGPLSQYAVEYMEKP